MLILYGLAAAGVVAGWRAGGLARVAAVVTALILVNPQLEPLLPVAVFAQAAVGRPTPAHLGAAPGRGDAGRPGRLGRSPPRPRAGTSTRWTS